MAKANASLPRTDYESRFYEYGGRTMIKHEKCYCSRRARDVERKTGGGGGGGDTTASVSVLRRRRAGVLIIAVLSAAVRVCGAAGRFALAGG